MRGDAIWYCSRCDEDIRVSMDDIHAVMTFLVSAGRHEQYDARYAHPCPDGGYGIAEIVEGVPTPMEEGKP